MKEGSQTMEKTTILEPCGGRGTPRLIHSKFNDAEASGIMNLLTEQEKLLQGNRRILSPKDKPQKLPPLQKYSLQNSVHSIYQHASSHDGAQKRERISLPSTPSYTPSQDDVIELLTSPQLARRYKRPRAANTLVSQLSVDRVTNKTLCVFPERPLTPIPKKDGNVNFDFIEGEEGRDKPHIQIITTDDAT